MSLGFNLAGSLAAIDKWVQDMNSEEEEDDDSDIAEVDGPGDEGCSEVAQGAATSRWSELDGACSDSLYNGTLFLSLIGSVFYRQSQAHVLRPAWKETPPATSPTAAGPATAGFCPVTRYYPW
jgi:hypothetical protein